MPHVSEHWMPQTSNRLSCDDADRDQGVRASPVHHFVVVGITCAPLCCCGHHLVVGITCTPLCCCGHHLVVGITCTPLCFCGHHLCTTLFLWASPAHHFVVVGITLLWASPVHHFVTRAAASICLPSLPPVCNDAGLSCLLSSCKASICLPRYLLSAVALYSSVWRSLC